MKVGLHFFLPLLLLLMATCTTPEQVSTTSNTTSEADEFIILSVNEATKYVFEEHDTSWTGKYQEFTLDRNDKKIVQDEYLAKSDSTWDDFSLFVDYLKLYEITPQHEIEGWVPDSGRLPKRVYSFEIFDGDSTHSFSYQDPENELRDFWQSQKVLLFVTFVENDLNWKKIDLP